MLLQELPPKHATAPGERAAELLDETRRLERDKTYYEALSNEVLLRVVPMLRFHARGFFNVVEETCGRLDDDSA